MTTLSNTLTKLSAKMAQSPFHEFADFCVGFGALPGAEDVPASMICHAADASREAVANGQSLSIGQLFYTAYVRTFLQKNTSEMYGTAHLCATSDEQAAELAAIALAALEKGYSDTPGEDARQIELLLQAGTDVVN